MFDPSIMIGATFAGIIFGFIAGLVATRKGRSPVRWFLLALIFGYFSVWVLILVAFLPPARSKACPKCAEKSLPDAKVCRFCGYDFGSP